MMDFLLFASYSRVFWWYSYRTRIDGLCTNAAKLEEVHISQRTFTELPVYFVKWMGSGRKGEYSPSGSLSNTNEALGRRPKGRRTSWWLRSSTESTLRNSLETRPKCSILGRIISKAQDQGLKFWQTKSFAIMTYSTKPGDCIDRVISQDGDPVIFERLVAPRPAPKVTLKKNWQSQQQQHSSFNTDVLSLWKQETQREDQAAAQDVTDHSTEADLAHRKLVHTTLNMGVETRLGDKEVSTNALMKNEAAKEETTETITKAIQQKIVFAKICRRRRWCLAKNLAKLFSRWVTWSSLNWRHPEFIAHHVFTTFLKERWFAHVASMSDPTRRWYDVSKHLLKISKHPTSVRLSSLQEVTNTARTCGRNITIRQKTHYEVRKEQKKFYVDLWDRWQNDETSMESQLAIGWSDGWVRYLDHTALNDISHKATPEQRGRYHNLIYLRGVDEDRQAPHWSTRPGYQEAKIALVEVQTQSRQDLEISFIPRSDRKHVNDPLDPSVRGYLECLSTHWAESFTKERELPTSSSSSQWSSTSWWATHSWSSNWKGWHNTAGRMTSGQTRGVR